LLTPFGYSEHVLLYELGETAMNLKTYFVALALASFCCAGTSAQTVTEIPVADLGAAEFAVDANGKKEFIWRRPPEVEYVMLSGCGGGGNGHAGDGIGFIHAGGGEASKLLTVLVRVNGDAYKVVLGAGGENTVFSGEGVTITFVAGATGISAVLTQPFVGEQNIDRDSRGGDSPFGIGAEASTIQNGHGRDASVRCAGGGGGLHQGKSGSGGPGFLTIYPMPDLARFARVLGIIEKLSQENKVSPTSKVEGTVPNSTTLLPVPQVGTNQ
jgi:hypothetical protein